MDRRNSGDYMSRQSITCIVPQEQADAFIDYVSRRIKENCAKEHVVIDGKAVFEFVNLQDYECKLIEKYQDKFN